MILICEDCGKKYRIDPEKITGEQAKFRCKNCSFVMVVKKPSPKAEGTGARPEPVTEPLAPLTPAREDSATAPPADEALATAPDVVAQFAQKRGFGLTGKVTTVMLVVSLLPLLAFSGVSLFETNARMRAEKEVLASQVTAGLAGQVDEWLDKNIRALRTAARLPEMVGMDPKAQEGILKTLHEEYPWVYLAFTLDPQGMNVARNDDQPLKDYSDRLYYRNVAGGADLSWQTLIGKTSKKPALVLAVPILRDGQLVGVMAAAMALDAVSDRVAAWTEGKTGFAFLVDETGKVVAHQVAEYVQEERNLGGHPLVTAHRGGREGALYFQDTDGSPSFGYVRGTTHGWALAIQQSESEAFSQLRKALFFSLGVLGATVLGVLLVAWYSGRALVRPIRTLTDAANRISVGELDTQIGVRSRDEIGDLADAISRMQDSIRLSIERLRRRR